MHFHNKALADFAILPLSVLCIQLSCAINCCFLRAFHSLYGVNTKHSQRNHDTQISSLRHSYKVLYMWQTYSCIHQRKEKEHSGMQIHKYRNEKTGLL